MIEPPVEEIVRKIAEAFGSRRIVMFGSRARGDTGPDSDLDLMVEMETHERPAQRVRVISAVLPAALGHGLGRVHTAGGQGATPIAQLTRPAHRVGGQGVV